MGYFRILLFLITLNLLASTSCSGLDEGDKSNGPINGAQSTGGVAAASGSGGSVVVVDSGIETAQGGTGGVAQAAGSGGVGGTVTNADAGRSDSSINHAGTGGQAGGAADASVAESGVQPPLSTASCCEEHAEPGCNNAQTQACVCEKLPDCCTATWDMACMFIATDRFCEPGVRECVCGPAAEGGWELTDCCETYWDETLCDRTAVIKCGAKEDC